MRDELRQVEKNSFGETSATKPKIGPSNWNKDRRQGVKTDANHNPLRGETMAAGSLLDLDWTAAILLFWLLASLFFLCSKPLRNPPSFLTDSARPSATVQSR